MLEMGKRIYLLLSRAKDGDLAATKDLIQICSHIAEAYLLTKSSKNQKLLSFINVSMEDLAIDAIADLFESESGHLVKFERWMNKFASMQSNSAWFIELRRMVCTQVSDYLFQMYRTMDPSISKIIRNLKRSVNQEMSSKLALCDNNTSVCLLSSKNFKTRLLEQHVLTIHLNPVLRYTTNTPDFLKILYHLLQNFEPESVRISIRDLVYLIIQLQLNLNDIENVSKAEECDPFEKALIEEVLNKSISQAKQQFYTTYVSTAKISLEDYELLLKAVKSIIGQEYNLYEEPKLSFQRHFLVLFPHLSDADYTRKYKSIIEYMVKNARSIFLSYIEEEKFSA